MGMKIILYIVVRGYINNFDVVVVEFFFIQMFLDDIIHSLLRHIFRPKIFSFLKLFIL